MARRCARCDRGTGCVKLVLATYALLWWAAEDSWLGASAAGLIADPRHDVLVSIVSLWEISIKQRLGKLRGDVDVIARDIGQTGFKLLEITVPHLVALASLPSHHRDPFDHLLIAQAIVERATFVSDDRRAGAYPVDVMSCGG